MEPTAWSAAGGSLRLLCCVPALPLSPCFVCFDYKCSLERLIPAQPVVPRGRLFPQVS